MKITIYELLGLIKDGKAPKKIKHCGAVYKHIYFDVYKNHDYEDTLSGDLLFADRLIIQEHLTDEVIILDEEDEFIDIEEIEYKPRKVQNAINDLIKNQKKIITALKENK